MSIVIPNVIEVAILTTQLTPAHTLKLYGNNVTPSATSIAADFTEISGGGYANKPITFANWTITGGAPTVALYNTTQQWTFTGAIGGAGTIYGYFITKNSDGTLLLAERFPAGVIPFSPINGSIIRVTPRITCEST